jgi:hypothetical protein
LRLPRSVPSSRGIGEIALGSSAIRKLGQFLRDFDLALGPGGVLVVHHLSGEIIDQILAAHLLQEGFFPDLARSWPPLGVSGRKGRIGDAVLTAPAVCDFTQPSQSTPLDERQYDLCFPLTAIPLARLRREDAEWIDNRGIRQFAELPGRS